MQRVIYADVLVVINIYITCFLLKSSALLAKVNPDRLRLFIASFLGGLYSLTVLLPDKLQNAISPIRFAAVALFVFVAFGFTSAKAFLRLSLCFLFCSFIFAGLMLALWYFVCPEGMYFNGSVVYFDIDIKALVILTVVCYAFITSFDRLFRTRAPVNTVFICKVLCNGREYSLRAFLDTGNRLKDYFTGKPVIIAHREHFSDLFPGEAEVENELNNEKIRYIFCSTLSGKGLLPAFSPDSVHIKGAEYDFITDAVTVAITDKTLLNGEYDAILPVDLFDKNYDRKDEGESEKIEAYI